MVINVIKRIKRAYQRASKYGSTRGLCACNEVSWLLQRFPEAIVLCCLRDISDTIMICNAVHASAPSRSKARGLVVY